MVNELNESNSLTTENFNLFMIDVAKLYPSIQSELAEEALVDLFGSLDEEDANIGEAVKSFVKLSLEESYVTYKERVFKPKIGIPTGGSLSRQIADTFLHWLLFKNIDTSVMNTTELRFWKRFIDDGIGIWKGTRRTFISFINKLNKEANKYGIHFPIEEVQFGKTVHFLDVTIYIDEHNLIQYKSYTKPTDSKRYLKPQSFHPKSVFKSVPFSQMIRTLERNSTQQTKVIEMGKLKEDLKRSGYEQNELEEIEERVMERIGTAEPRSKTETITFPLFYFAGFNEFKKIITDFKPELQQIIGETQIVMAVKKKPSLCNKLVQNKLLSMEERQLPNQKCNATNCSQCPLVNTSKTVIANNKRAYIAKR